MSNPSAQISNAVYLINDLSGTPVVSGTASNSVIGKNATDSWPINKTALVSAANPALFDYTVTIKGGYSSRPNGLLQTPPPPAAPPTLAPTNPVYTDVFDARMRFVPNSFYVVDTSNGNIYAPPLGTNIVSGSTISVNLNTLEQYASIPDGTITGTPVTPPINWFMYKRNYQVHYQLEVTALEIPQARLANTASIAVNNNECTFQSSAMVNYTPNPLSKKIATDGSDLVKADIVINPDGGVVFSPPPPATEPTLVTAKDVLQNLVIYTDTIKFYSQTQTGPNSWDGRWIPMPVNFNDDIAWSVNVVSLIEVDFIIPNKTPVRITYDAMCTLPQGDTGSIVNTISIYGSSDSNDNTIYTVGRSDIGASASQVPVRVFKKDAVNNFNLAGATFDLYVTQINLGSPSFGNPPLGLPNDLTQGGYSFGRLQTETTDMLGVAVFSDIRITARYQYLFLLVEGPLDGYDPMGPLSRENYTFFTINPTIDGGQITAAEASLGLGDGIINRTSDFVTVNNNPVRGTPMTLRIRKLFWEQNTSTSSPFNRMTREQVLSELANLKITVTDPTGTAHIFTAQQLLDGTAVLHLGAFPFGGIFMLQESDAGRAGYEDRTNPQLPIRPYIWPNQDREVVVQINNVYTGEGIITHPVEQAPRTGVERNLTIPVVLLSVGAVCIGGAEFFRRWNKKKKAQGTQEK